MAEQADAEVSKIFVERRVGSSPTFPTILDAYCKFDNNQTVVGSIPTLQANNFAIRPVGRAFD